MTPEQPKKLGDAIEQWVKHVESKRTRALLLFIYNMFLVHWYKPLSQTTEKLDQAMHEALASGDPEYASYNLSNAITNRYLGGTNWQEINNFIKEKQQVLELTQQKAGNYFLNFPAAHISNPGTPQPYNRKLEALQPIPYP